MGVPVLVEVGESAVEVVVEGELPPEVYRQLAEIIRKNCEAFLGLACVLLE